MKYNLNKLGDKKCKGNEGLIRKNIKFMNETEIKYLKSMIKGIDWLNISKHAEEKQLLNVMEIKKIIQTKSYEIIDYNYIINSKEERVMVRTKNIYEIKNQNGKIEECYCKIVISLKTHCIITMWANRVVDEEYKQNNLNTRYYENFDIINKKVKF